MRRTICAAILFLGLVAAPAAARGDHLAGPNELSGGMGGQIAFTWPAPGGFKLFLEYARLLTGVVWFDAALNLVFGGSAEGACDWDPKHHWHCHDRHWGGTAIEAFVGVKFKFQPSRIPLVPFARVGGTVQGVFFHWDEGLALGVRFGGGLKYMFFPSFGAGLEMNCNLGPLFGIGPDDAQFMATLDIGAVVEWSF